MLKVSNFMRALAIVAESDLVAALPRQFVAKYATLYNLVASEPPFPFLSAPLRVVAPQAALRDAGLVWLLDAIERQAKRAKMARPGRKKR